MIEILLISICTMFAPIMESDSTSTVTINPALFEIICDKPTYVKIDQGGDYVVNAIEWALMVSRYEMRIEDKLIKIKKKCVKGYNHKKETIEVEDWETGAKAVYEVETVWRVRP